MTLWKKTSYVNVLVGEYLIKYLFKEPCKTTYHTDH